MKTKLSLIALVSLATLGAAAHAAPRQDWIPAGEAIGDEVTPPPATSATTRVAVKAQTLQARHAGDLKEAGEASGAREQRAELSRESLLARASVKAATYDAIRRHSTLPAGDSAEYPML